METRLIDANSILENLKTEVDNIPKRTNYTIGIADGLGYAIAAIECAQTVGGYISCKTKMPEGGQHVLICTGMKKLFVAVYNAPANMFMQRVHSTIHSWYANEVTHWMPLPQLPKEITE